MAKDSITVLHIVLWLSSCVFYSCANNSKPIINKLNNTNIDIYIPNIDSNYNRQEVLEEFALLLDTLQFNINNYVTAVKYFTIDEFQESFFVYDLVDTTNYAYRKYDNKYIQFIDTHIYHFSSSLYRLSISNICILNEGELIIFKAINCKNNINSLEEVLECIDTLYQNNSQKQEIIERVKNYKKYGFYFRRMHKSCPDCEKE